jgi:hypothetical protein
VGKISIHVMLLEPNSFEWHKVFHFLSAVPACQLLIVTAIDLKSVISKHAFESLVLKI